LEAELGGDDHLPPKGNQCFPHQFFIGKRSVDLSRVEESNELYPLCRFAIGSALEQKSSFSAKAERKVRFLRIV
jgi:hypothetical protein